MTTDLPDADEADRLAVERLPTVEAGPVERVRLLRRDCRLDAAGDDARAQLLGYAREAFQQDEHRHHGVLGDAVEGRRRHGGDGDPSRSARRFVDGAAAQLDPDDGADARRPFERRRVNCPVANEQGFCVGDGAVVGESPLARERLAQCGKLIVW